MANIYAVSRAVKLVLLRKGRVMCDIFKEIENTSWKVLAYGIYGRVVDVSEIERVSAANE